MFRKVLFSLLFTALMSVAVSAQMAAVTGRIVTKGADGKQTGVAGAAIDVYRIDMNATGPSTTTDKNGRFDIAGLPIQGTFVLAVSAPNLHPAISPVFKPGSGEINLSLDPGDGARVTETQARDAAAFQTNGGKLTDEQKKQQAEFEKQVAAVKEKNANVEKTNAILAASVKEGNEAFNAKNYDLAIAKYTEGINADPNYVGSAPSLLNNRGASYIAQAADTYNAAVKQTDVEAKVAGLAKTKTNITEAVKGYQQAWTVLSNAPATDIQDKAAYEQVKVATLNRARDAFRVAVQTEQVDPTVIEAAKVMIPLYIGVEQDAAKKAQANLILADLYRVTGDAANAIAAYEKILETSPDDPDALAGAGLSLVNQGYMTNDKATFQKGADRLAKYVSIAPDGHKFKTDAAQLLEVLKKEQNVTPQKAAPTGKKRGN